MTTSPAPRALLADIQPLGAMPWLIVASFAVAAVIPGAAEAKSQRGAVDYDGYWNVRIITQAGACDQNVSFPVTIAGGRVMGGGMAAVSGSVSRGGGVAVRVSGGGATASGSGRLGASTGGGRWAGRGSAGVCSGRWQATRS